MQLTSICFFVGLFFFSLLSQSLVHAAPEGKLQDRTGPYVIRSGDEIDVKFFYTPELNERITVRPDGYIALQLIPEVKAIGLTAQALSERLQALYEPHLAEQKISVMVRSFSSQRIYVDGEVSRPGMIPLVGSLTLSQAIAQAGGFKETAHPSQVLVLRQGPNAPQALVYDFAALVKGRQLGEDPSLHPEDVVFVTRSRIANVNRWLDQYIRRNVPISTGLFWNMF